MLQPISRQAQVRKSAIAKLLSTSMICPQVSFTISSLIHLQGKIGALEQCRLIKWTAKALPFAV